MMTSTTANREMKVEPDFGSMSPAEELLLLRTRVRELEREKAQVDAENRRLKDLLVNEIPSLLSAMRQNVGVGGRESDPEVFQGLSPCAERLDCAGFPPSMPADAGFGQAEDVDGFMQTVSDAQVALVSGGFPASIEDSGPHCALPVEDSPSCPSPACSSPDFGPIRDCTEMEHVHTSGHLSSHARPVEVYPGSGVFCEAQAWTSAIQAQSPTAMVRMLLLGVFDTDTLLHSNLRGGRSRRPMFPNHRVGLDPHKLEAIYNATLARFPLARKGQIGTGINSKLSEMRFRSRRANQERRYL
nr:uncharacterized protein LOC111848831 isoform X1 [Paramormyrops kingsleyae]